MSCVVWLHLRGRVQVERFVADTDLMMARIQKLCAQKIAGDRAGRAGPWPPLDSTCWDRKTKNVRSCKGEIESYWRDISVDGYREISQLITCKN